MKNNFDMRQIANEAFETFPPLGEDGSAACNFAQRMLTKAISESRKSGGDISNAQARSLRDELDAELAAIDHVKISPMTDNAVATVSSHPLPSADASEIAAIIAAVFHTSTDGSPDHLSHLKHTALDRVEQYLATTKTGFLDKRRFRKQAKQILNNHLNDLQKDTTE